MDRKSKTLVSVGLLLAFTIALPLFIWGIITQRFELRERAQVTPTCQPRPSCLDNVPHPCEISEPDEGWCPVATASATTSATATAAATATASPTSSPPAIGGPEGEPNSCGGTCGSKYNCGANLYCYQGFCRNPVCPSDSDCVCATPTPTPKATPKKTGSPKPTPTMEIVYLSPIATATPEEDTSGVSSGSPEVNAEVGMVESSKGSYDG